MSKWRDGSVGGNPGSIGPSQGRFSGGGKHHPPHHKPEREEWTGKVLSVIYDRFGDFEGFVLLTDCGHEHWFCGREPGIERLVRYAWDDRAVITVFVEKHCPRGLYRLCCEGFRRVCDTEDSVLGQGDDL